jgi:RHS repeat-associated protein
MSTEEYLRTEVFGDQNRMQQKRMANLAQLERRAEDTPISMEEYVRHIVYAEDLPDAAACAPVAQHAIPVVMSRPTPAVAARAAVPYATPDTGHKASGTALQAVAVPNNRNSASIPRYAGAAATGLGSCCVALPGMRHGFGAAGSATLHAVSSGMQPDTQPPLLNVRLQRNAQGRIIFKLEGAGDSMREYDYAYDAQGHLTHAWLNGSLVEQYAYNETGQRVADETAWRGPRTLAYDAAGRLVQAGNVRYEYTPEGSLCHRIRATRQGDEITSFAYGADTRLDSVILPDGTQITYYYGSALGPTEKHVNGVLAESYIWKDALRLGAWIDHTSGTRCLFHYASGHSPVAVTMEHPQGAATYSLGFDQIGSLKLVVLPDANGGKLIKEMAYDSFGTMLNDSNPELFLSVGFASGLVDRHTGFIRFGYRDYSPELGRFTALDPARDTRGDGDLWDYCVDDPINCVDPWGLKTKGVGVGFSASGFGFGAGAGAMVVKDDKGNWGVEYYGDYGASSGFGVSGEASYQATTAKTIKDLAGKSQKIGASYQLPIPGVPSLGTEKIQGAGYTGEGYSLGVGIKALPIPMEVHVKEEQSRVKEFGSSKE